MITTSNLDKARKQLKTEEKPRIVKAQNDEFNRKIVENGQFDILLSPEENTRPTTLKHLDSGVNHILAKKAAEKGIAVGIDLASLRNLG